MDRRTFILLTGSASAAFWRPAGVAPGARRAAGNLRFDLDEERRWSLWYHGDGAPVPLVRGAALGVWVGDTLVTLADLQDISVANRRPPGGESLAVRGRAPAGVWIEAEFAAWEAGPGAQGSISASIYPDRVLATIRGVRFLAVPEPQVLPGAGGLAALLNGYESRSACRVTTAPGVSHAVLGVTREGRGLAFGFDAGEPGESQVRVSSAGLDAFSDWLPGRPVRPEGDTSTLRIAFLPGGDSLAALGALVTPASTVDRERLATLTAPAGWRTPPGIAFTEDEVLANLEFCATRLDRRFLRYIQLGSGYQRAMGDWDTNARFPNGHRWLTHRIHERGFLAGLWLAPFAAGAQSKPATEHPGWLAKDSDGVPLVMAPGGDGSGVTYALDGAHPEVQEWLRELGSRIVREWGYDFIELDLLHWATAPAAHHGGLTHAEAYRHGLGALREGVGTEAFVVANGAPLQHSAGLVSAMRIGPDVDPRWGNIEGAARAAALRAFYHRAAWLNDAGGAVARPPLSLDEARAWASVVALAGGVNLLSDALPELPADRLPILQRTLPVAGVAGRPVGALSEERDVAPAIITRGTAAPLGGPWRFRTGDDARYAAPGYDDESWETIRVPAPWEEAGHPGYDGVAWYRTRFPLAPLAPGDGSGDGVSAVLELGKVDDADETFVNGVRVGATEGRRTYRRYVVPPAVLNWGGENVVAMRVRDSGGPGGGGLWNVHRERPAGAWIVEGAPGWWTVTLVNWDDEPRSLAHPIAALGIAGGPARLAAYDVWGERPLPDVEQTLKATLAPHGVLTVGLRAAAAHPQIVGTTRHVVQGAIDVAAEGWEAASRTLRARSVALDGRPYAVTIAVPPGLRPGACTASARCTVRRLEVSGHAVIEWPAGTADDLEWSLGFGATAPNRGRPRP